MEKFSALLALREGIYLSTMVNSPHKGLVIRGFDVALMFAWTWSWANNQVAVDFRRHDVHVMSLLYVCDKFGIRKSFRNLTFCPETLLNQKFNNLPKAECVLNHGLQQNIGHVWNKCKFRDMAILDHYVFQL